MLYQLSMCLSDYCSFFLLEIARNHLGAAWTKPAANNVRVTTSDLCSKISMSRSARKTVKMLRDLWESSQIENRKLLMNRNVDDLSTVRNAQSKNENGLSRIFGTNFEIST